MCRNLCTAYHYSVFCLVEMSLHLPGGSLPVRQLPAPHVHQRGQTLAHGSSCCSQGCGSGSVFFKWSDPDFFLQVGNVFAVKIQKGSDFEFGFDPS